MTFEAWMEAVDQAVWQIGICSVHDLADQPFHEWYTDGFTPKEAAEITLEDNGFNVALYYQMLAQMEPEEVEVWGDEGDTDPLD